MKKKEEINLRTDLKDNDINVSLRKWNCQNFTEIINKPKKDKYHRRDSNRSNAIRCDLNLDKFSNYDFQLSESTRYNQTSGSLKDLMDQNYTQYIHSIKKMYPNFRFNHYSNYSERVRLNSSMMSSNTNTELKTYNTFDTHVSFFNDDYIPSTRLANIAIGKDYLVSKAEFRLRDELLEQNQNELNNKARECDYKVEAIEMELERILSNSNLLYNYIERNMSLGKEIDYSIKSLKRKKNVEENLNRKYINNSSQLILKGMKRKNIKQSMKQVLNLLKLYHLMSNLSSLNKTEIECNEISEAISDSKALIKKMDKLKKLKCVQQCDKELQVLENQSEHKLSGDISNILKKLLMQSIQCDDIKAPVSSSMKKNAEFYYNEDFQMNYNDYAYGNNHKRIILISKSEGCKSFLRQLLDCISIIIKDNFDIDDFIELIESVFRDIIMKLFDIIQREYSSDEQIKLIEVLSQAFKMLYLNYEYIIYLFELNFGWVKKIFASFERKIVEEMNKLLSFVTSSIVNEEVLSGELKLYLSSRRELGSICAEYFRLVKVEYWFIFKQFDLEFLVVYFEKQRNYLLECFEKESWIQMNEVDDKYIRMTQIILSDSTQLSCDSFESTNATTTGNANDASEKKEEYIVLKESKYRAIALTLEEIAFLYSSLHLVFAFNKTMIADIATNAFYVLKVISTKAKSLLTGENDKKKITDKEIALLCSNIQLIKQIAHSFSIATTTQDSDVYVNLMEALEDIKTECNNGMIQLLNAVNIAMIEDLASLDFANYPFFDKDYNNYIKTFTKMKKLYNGMLHAFDNKDIVDIFNSQLLNSFTDIEKVISSKCRIEVDNSLKQFRREMFYMKKVVRMFDLMKTDSFIDKIESFSKIINPTKVFKKKKTKEIAEI